MASNELARAAGPSVLAALTDTPVVVVNGARQVGKTTLARSLPYPGTVVHATMDDPSSRTAAHDDPRSFVQRPVDTLVIDEVQLEPGLFRAIKAEVDQDRRPGRFVLTGSSRILAAPDMADSLVGRTEVIELWPFSQGELAGHTDTFVDRVFGGTAAVLGGRGGHRADLVDRVLTGGFPESVARGPGRRRAWFASYLDTMVQTVIRELSAIERLADIPAMVRLCAARSGTELNVASLARELALPERTANGYLALLANAFILQLIPAWSSNLSAKVVRRPKLVLVDSGMAAHLQGFTASAPPPADRFGPLLETFVLMELRRQSTWSDHSPTLWHFRDRSGVEVDAILERPDGSIVGIEVKATSTPRPDDFRGLRFLEARLGDRFKAGLVLSTAPDPVPFGPKLAAVPVAALWAP